MKYTLLFIWVLVLVITKTNAQTCIIVLRKQKEIVLATDSRIRISVSETMSNGRTYFRDSLSTMCKIIKGKHFYFTNAGYRSDQIYDAGKFYLNREATLVKTAQDFSITAKRIYETHIKDLQKDSIRFNNEIEHCRHATSYLLGFENKIPKVITMYFYNKTKSYNSPVDITLTFDTNFCKPIAALDKIYEKPFYSGYLKTPDVFYYLDTFGEKEGILKMMDMEIKAKPKSVSKPIDILSIKQNSYKWVNGGSCTF